jgi:hypothetical protein
MKPADFTLELSNEAAVSTSSDKPRYCFSHGRLFLRSGSGSSSISARIITSRDWKNIPLRSQRSCTRP